MNQSHSFDSNFYAHQDIQTSVQRILRNSIVPSFPNNNSNALTSLLDERTITFISGIAVLSLLIVTLGNLNIFIITISYISWIFYINVFVHAGTIRHHGVILGVLIFCFWLTIGERKLEHGIKQIARIVFLFSISILMFVSWGYTKILYQHDYIYPFSGGSDMGRYIIENNLTRIPIIAAPSFGAESVLPYLPYKTIWSSEIEEFWYDKVDLAKYIPPKSVSQNDALAQAKKYFPDNSKLLFLFTTPYTPIEEYDLKLVHVSRATYFWTNETENLWLYGNNK